MQPKDKEAADWLYLAWEDLQVAQHESASQTPVWRAVAFHAQQAVEKALKAFLAYHNVQFTKTHDLRVLLEQCAAADRTFADLAVRTVPLTRFAVRTRYPPPAPRVTPDEAAEALRIAADVRRFVLDRLPKHLSS